MARVRTTEGRMLRVEVAAGVGLAALGLGICGWLFGDVSQHDAQPVPGSGDTGPTAGEVTPETQAAIGLAEEVPSETNDWFLKSPLPAETSTATATLTLIPENGAGGPVPVADIGEFLRQRLTMNLSLPGCEQSGNQSPDRADWVSEPAAAIETEGGDIQGLYDALRSKLPAGAVVRLCVNTEGWYLRVTTADGVPIWNQIKGDDGRWRWADHPNLIPVDTEGNIDDWRPARLPGIWPSGSEPLVLGGVPVEVQLDREGNPVAYFDPVSGEMISLLSPTAVPATATLAPATATLEPSPQPTAVVRPSPQPTPVPPEPAATEAPARHPSWPEDWSPPPGWPEDTVYRGDGRIRLYREVPVGSVDNPMPGFEDPEFTDITDCRTDPYCPGVSDEDLTVSQAIILARQTVGDSNVRLRIIYIGSPDFDSPVNPYHIVAIRVQIFDN